VWQVDDLLGKTLLWHAPGGPLPLLRPEGGETLRQWWNHFRRWLQRRAVRITMPAVLRAIQSGVSRDPYLLSACRLLAAAPGTNLSDKHTGWRRLRPAGGARRARVPGLAQAAASLGLRWRSSPRSVPRRRAHPWRSTSSRSSVMSSMAYFTPSRPSPEPFTPP
jgi:hypothetical protein